MKRLRNPHLPVLLATTALVVISGCSESSDDSSAPASSAATDEPDTTEATGVPATAAPTQTATSPATAPPSASDPAPATTAAPAAFPVTVEHVFGTTEIPAMPEAVVSASATMTGHLLALGIPVVAAQVLPAQSPLSDDAGFLLQWGDIAAAAGVEPIAGPEVNIEAIAAARPDLILGASFGGDAVTEDVYALLGEIAPTVVLDYSGLEWQELARTLGGATGHEADAEAVIAEFDARVEEVAATLDTTHPVVAAVITADGVNVLTEASPHGKLLASLGLTVVSPEGGSLDGEQGAQTRADVVSVSPELIPDEFGDASVLFIFGDEGAVDQALDLYPTMAALPATADGRLFPMGVESFRIDPYSARLLVDRVADALGASPG